MFVYDIVASVLVALIALFVIVRSGRMPPSLEPTSIGPGYWPSFLGWVLLVLAIVLLVQTIWKIRAARLRAGEGDPLAWPPGPIAFRSAGMCCVYALCSLFGVFSFILLKVGFLAGTVVVVPICMRLLGEKRLAVLAAYTVGVPLVVYVIFVRILGIALP